MHYRAFILTVVVICGCQLLDREADLSLGNGGQLTPLLFKNHLVRCNVIIYFIEFFISIV
jgi:hypothetical protein